MAETFLSSDPENEAASVLLNGSGHDNPASVSVTVDTEGISPAWTTTQMYIDDVAVSTHYHALGGAVLRLDGIALHSFEPLSIHTFMLELDGPVFGHNYFGPYTFTCVDLIPPTNPTPTDEAEDIDSGITTLAWDCDGTPDSYKVYFGTVFAGADYLGETTNKFISIEDEFLSLGIEYEWYVEAIYDSVKAQSDTWTFTTNALSQILAAPINPTPADTTADLSPSSLQLEWENYSTGGGVTFDVYLNDVKIAADIPKGTAESFSIGSVGLIYGQAYEWYVVAKRAGSTVTSATWTFTTKTLGSVPVPTGENAIAQKRRLIAAAADKIWYEDI